MMRAASLLSVAWMFMGITTAASADESLQVTSNLASDVVMTSGVHGIPYGYSISPSLSVPNVDTSGGHLTVTMEGPFCGAFVTNVRYTSTFNQPQWQQMRRRGDGGFTYTANRLLYLQFDVTQSNYSYSQCAYRVVLSSDDEGQGDNEEFLGVLDYNGGFVRRAPVTFRSATLVKGFRLEIPTFCGNVDVLEGGTLSSGIFDRAVQNRDGSFSVNRGAGLRATEIQVTLNGPTDSVCSIPVYGTL